MSTKFSVEVHSFAERHYIKSFGKKYKSHWAPAFISVKAILERFEKSYQSKRVVLVDGNQQKGIYKMDFKVSPKESAKSAGNRCIFHVDNSIQKITILLMYHKGDLPKGNETAEWKRLIKEGCPEFI